MNLFKVFASLCVLLVLCTQNAESGIILMLLLKMMALKGAFFLGMPLAIGSFMMGQGMGFFGGSMLGGYAGMSTTIRFMNRFYGKRKGATAKPVVYHHYVPAHQYQYLQQGWGWPQQSSIRGSINGHGGIVGSGPVRGHFQLTAHVGQHPRPGHQSHGKEHGHAHGHGSGHGLGHGPGHGLGHGQGHGPGHGQGHGPAHGPVHGPGHEQGHGYSFKVQHGHEEGPPGHGPGHLRGPQGPPPGWGPPGGGPGYGFGPLGQASVQLPSILSAMKNKMKETLYGKNYASQQRQKLKTQQQQPVPTLNEEWWKASQSHGQNPLNTYYDVPGIQQGKHHTALPQKVQQVLNDLQGAEPSKFETGNHGDAYQQQLVNYPNANPSYQQQQYQDQQVPAYAPAPESSAPSATVPESSENSVYYDQDQSQPQVHQPAEQKHQEQQAHYQTNYQTQGQDQHQHLYSQYLVTPMPMTVIHHHHEYTPIVATDPGDSKNFVRQVVPGQEVHNQNMDVFSYITEPEAVDHRPPRNQNQDTFKQGSEYEGQTVPAPSSAIKTYLESKLKEEIGSESSTPEKRQEAEELIAMLRQAYLDELMESFIDKPANSPTPPTFPGELPDFVPFPSDFVPNSTSSKPKRLQLVTLANGEKRFVGIGSDGKRKYFRVKKKSKPTSAPVSLAAGNATAEPTAAASFTVDLVNGVVSNKPLVPEAPVPTKFEHIDTTVILNKRTGEADDTKRSKRQTNGLGSMQELRNFADDIKKFFHLVSVLDQDKCLQKLVCEVHAKVTEEEKARLTPYENNILITFKVMNVLMPANSEDSTTLYRAAAKIGQLAKSAEICATTYSSCSYSSQEIIRMGNQVADSGPTSDANSIPTTTKASTRFDEFVPPYESMEEAESSPVANSYSSVPVMPQV